MGPLHRFVRQIRARPRLSIATALGLIVLLLLPSRVPRATRCLIGWDLATGLYLVLAWIVMFRAGLDKIQERARLQDDGAVAVLTLTVAAALASLAAIVLELIGLKQEPQRALLFRLSLAGTTILLSWFFVHTAFAMHYAHEYYMQSGPGRGPCLEFAGKGKPSYSDFLYFSFVIGATSQTADVNIASESMRRLVMVHGIIAFFFNTTLLALTINIAAGLT